MNDGSRNLCRRCAASDAQRRSRQADRLPDPASGCPGLACIALRTEDTGDGQGDWRACLYGTPDRSASLLVEAGGSGLG